MAAVTVAVVSTRLGVLEGTVEPEEGPKEAVQVAVVKGPADLAVVAVAVAAMGARVAEVVAEGAG